MRIVLVSQQLFHSNQLRTRCCTATFKNSFSSNFGVKTRQTKPFEVSKMFVIIAGGRVVKQSGNPMKSTKTFFPSTVLWRRCGSRNRSGGGESELFLWPGLRRQRKGTERKKIRDWLTHTRMCAGSYVSFQQTIGMFFFAPRETFFHPVR